MERQLKPMDGSYFPTLKTVYRSKDFQIWKTELKEELHKLKQKQRENERKAEIARLEMENSINAALAKI